MLAHIDLSDMLFITGIAIACLGVVLGIAGHFDKMHKYWREEQKAASRRGVHER